ncbi:hypothetical protein NFHSH190041_27050 [Shewanella sp. NFH-SH190041]|uniref:tetratricopeptide repeat protein n=1 Tax=Shewanella sp. NFH-SH190041 TaxID=2950245 RepID=UPI0021C2B1A4|nr:hypothetical protein [Shewanella sp. NFH-SH190041]BDM65253.1 hypothetical protein NFHSH190041_27050 [Shewanella sp. NFH-SH190041]
MNKILTIFLILISFKSIAFDEYSGIHTYHLDIMKNGKIFTLTEDSGEGTLKILDDKNDLVLNSSNLIIDGYSFFYKIKNLPGNHKGFKFINRGSSFDGEMVYTVEYYNKSFFITNVEESANIRRDPSYQFSYEITCNRKVSYNLNKNPSPEIPFVIFDYNNNNYDKFCKKKIYPIFPLKDLEEYLKEKIMFEIIMDDAIHLVKEIPITNKNIATYNNIAYYVYINDHSNAKVAIYILEHVIKKSPNRSVAYLNIADAFLSEKNYSKATEMYKKYVSILKAKGKEDKIPKRVNAFLLHHK